MNAARLFKSLLDLARLRVTSEPVETGQPKQMWLERDPDLSVRYVCVAESPDRYLCSLPPDHAGNHVAEACGEVCATWAQDPPPPAMFLERDWLGSDLYHRQHGGPR